MAVIRNAESERMARQAIVLDLGDLRRQADAMSARAREHAEAIVAEARLERERIIAGAAEAGRAAGHAEGLARGLKDGQDQGRAEALQRESARIATLLEGWERALGVFERDREDMLLDGRAELLGLALEIAGRVVKRVVEVTPGVIEDQLESALQMAARSSRLSVEVSPPDLETARLVLPGLVERLMSGAHASVAARDGLSQGSVVVRTEGGEIDASLETQLARIAAALMPAGVRRAEGTPPPAGSGGSARAGEGSQP